MLALPLEVAGQFEASFDGSWKWFFTVRGISIDKLRISEDHIEFHRWIGGANILYKEQIKSIGLVTGKSFVRLRFNHLCKDVGFPSSLIFTSHYQSLPKDDLKLLFENLGYIVQSYV